MCGIVGILCWNGGISEQKLEAFTDRLAHRGPDARGIWISENGCVGIGHRRLSIVDPDARSDQPMVRRDLGLTLAFNGEIYNHREIRRELVTYGYRFATTSDTEVIAVGYDRWGSDVVDRLRGMFAFVLVDEKRNRVVATRDPLGIKPLYIADNGRCVMVSSEIPPLRKALGAAERVDEDAIVDFLTWGSIAAPRTFWRSISSLRPGEIRTMTPTGTTTRFVVDPIDAFRPNRRDLVRDPSKAQAIVAEAVEESVRVHLQADVAVGMFLSAGVDSTAIAHVASASGGNLVSVTVAQNQSSEAIGAAQTAQRLGLDHVVVAPHEIVSPDGMDKPVLALGQPTVDGINSYMVSAAFAGTGVKVALSGIGGDELFGGYPTFRRLPMLDRIASVPGIGRIPRPASFAAKHGARNAWRWLRYCNDGWGAYVVARALFAPNDVALLTGRSELDVLELARQRLGPIGKLTSVDEITQVESRQFLRHQLLRDTDAASMSQSIEVRTPFVDRGIIEGLSHIDGQVRGGDQKKMMLRNVGTPAGSQPSLMPKEGFELPFDRWIRSRTIEVRKPQNLGLDAYAMETIRTLAVEGRLHWSRAWALHVLALHSEG